MNRDGERGKVLLSVTGFDPAAWHDALKQAAPQRDIVLRADKAGDPDITYAVVWKQPPGVLRDLPNLRAVFSIGAGVDHIFSGDEVPDVPIVRVVADDLTERMSEYVVWQVLDHHRKGPLYREQQSKTIWHEVRMQPAAKEVSVGILGLGTLGRDAANKLRMLGFKVAGWSRTPKQMEGVQTYAGRSGLDEFLAVSDVVVCLLPLTQETHGILSASFFEKMKRHGALGAPVLINAGRGGLQVETDIIEALDAGRLGAVTLDVFQTEPLPADSSLWRHPNITITPHCAATSDPRALVPPMVAQMDAHDAGKPLVNLVDREAGY
ncbi:2-hydroxyacid dehydrogenase [Oricola cellulosilytica]|uniref:Glyoxylate/hydroxypyruvate reductase A n=1 Tax=Oricola cellulosilytica TaxID=1429082 RepID=A0A4V2MP61_9HYPH|nr:glyoxylate/hydroxypyruvate reductase A [Oricola cellulosilytica]TCD16432.1 glyoxylate/hydroxypyruvate reductase A [Oricola cellulosilytica]